MFVWNPNPVIFSADHFTLLWYGVFFATGLAAGSVSVWRKFKTAGIPANEFEKLLILSFIGIFAGARLCHCLCYEPQYFLSHPVEMLLPVAQGENGKYYFYGYHGLASHGGILGLIIAIGIFGLLTRRPVLKIMDFTAIATPLAGGFIRLGNLMNSEIIGSPTSVPWAFVFKAYDTIPRHPAQLYEAVFYFLLFAIMSAMYRKWKFTKVKDGFYLGFSMTAIGIFRFLIEFVKEVQVNFEREMTLNMGQLLSLGFIVAGIVILSNKIRINTNKNIH